MGWESGGRGGLTTEYLVIVGTAHGAEALCPALCLPRAICKEYANKLRVVKMCTPALQMKKLRLRGVDVTYPRSQH